MYCITKAKASIVSAWYKMKTSKLNKVKNADTPAGRPLNTPFNEMIQWNDSIECADSMSDASVLSLRTGVYVHS